MPSVKLHTTIREYQSFVEQVYGLSNDRHFDVKDMLANIQRFTMRGIKGIRKKEPEKTKFNLLISLSWLMSLANQLHIDIEQEIWERFPAVCSYCGTNSCSCRTKKVQKRKKIIVDEKKRPKTLDDFQNMFKNIYPLKNRTIEDAGIHLAEETGELSETTLKYQGLRKKEDFRKVARETADYFSCLMGVFNSLNLSVAKELSLMFSQNCHVCKKAPCECSFSYIVNFKS